MKSKLFGSLFAIISLFACLNCQAQTNIPEEDAVLTLKMFYAEYMVYFSDMDGDPKLIKLRKKYCTAGFLKKFGKLVEEQDADPLIKGQDSNPANITTLKVNKDARKADTYMVSYQDLATKNWINIKLHLVKDGNVCKIDAIL